jgi:hypothetical protein
VPSFLWENSHFDPAWGTLRSEAAQSDGKNAAQCAVPVNPWLVVFSVASLAGVVALIAAIYVAH